MAAANNRAIELLFGVAGGASIASGSGKNIADAMRQIVSQIEQSGVTSLEFTASDASLQKLRESIRKAVSNIKVTVDGADIGSTRAPGTTGASAGAEDLDKAIAFVDFEYWFYSYRDLLHISPNVPKWAAEITGQYHVSDIMVFADLSYPKIQQEAQQLRTVTNTIIDTSNLTPGHKKNMTDFIMLDYIYQTAIERPEITTYILFTGDGHFQSAARFLSLKRKKTIILYGVRGSISKDLQAIATKTVELPVLREHTSEIYPLIVNNIADVANKPQIIPTFNGTINAVARANDLDVDLVRISLLEMMDKNYIYQKDYRVDFNRKVKIVAANWELLAKDGLWSYE